MNRSIRAHFDGKVFVPDEPVDAPINQPLRLRVENGQVASSNGLGPCLSAAELIRRLDAIPGVVTGHPITDDSLRRENLYDDRT